MTRDGLKKASCCATVGPNARALLWLHRDASGGCIQPRPTRGVAARSDGWRRCGFGRSVVCCRLPATHASSRDTHVRHEFRGNNGSKVV